MVWNDDASPFHEGERQFQEYFGVRKRLEAVGRRVIYPEMTDQHRVFFGQLPFLVLGGLNAESWPIASVLFGAPGFVETPDSNTMIVNSRFLDEDPLSELLQKGDPVGLLGIEPPTRRSNRANGVVVDRQPAQITIKIVQAYGNCPQYIEARDFDIVRSLSEPQSKGVSHFTELDAETTELIRRADRFYVASQNDREDKYEAGGLDVSHLGGLPGFVKVDGNTLTIPDFPGNYAFKTMGNFAVHPTAGLLFLDDQTQDLIQLWGNVELQLDLTEELRTVPGARRSWKFTLKRGIRHLATSPLKWGLGVPGPGAEQAGNWPENTRKG